MQHVISFRRLVALLVFGGLLLGLLTVGAGFAVAQNNSQNDQDRQDQIQQDDDSSGTSSDDNATDSQSAADDQYDDPQAEEECANPREVASVGPETGNTITPFEVTSRTFRVTYDVTFEDPNNTLNNVRIEIQDPSGIVDSEDVRESGADSFIFTIGPGSFDLVVNVEPQDGAEYTITVEDCIRATSNDDRRHDDIINVPKKKRLAKTGGMALPGAAFLALALVGTGVSVLRHAARRNDS